MKLSPKQKELFEAIKQASVGRESVVIWSSDYCGSTGFGNFGRIYASASTVRSLAKRGLIKVIESFCGDFRVRRVK